MTLGLCPWAACVLDECSFRGNLRSWEEGGLWSQTHQATFVFAFFNLGDNPVSGTSVFSCRNVMPCLQPLTQIRPAAVAQRDRHRRRVPFLCSLHSVGCASHRCKVPRQGPRRKGGKRGGGTHVASIRKTTFAQNSQSRCTCYVSLTRTGSRGHPDAGEVGTRLSC